jgi:hypothetical protein
VVEAARANWFLLDSLDRVNATPGVLGKEQVDWIGKALTLRKGTPQCISVAPSKIEASLSESWIIMSGSSGVAGDPATEVLKMQLVHLVDASVVHYARGPHPDRRPARAVHTANRNRDRLLLRRALQRVV